MSPEELMEPPIFVVGCPRTGTTLVGQILDTHSRIAVYLETTYYPLFGPIVHLYGDLRRRANLRRLLADLIRSTRVQRVTPPSVDALEEAVRDPSLEGVLAAFLHVYALERGKRRGAEKTPLHYRYVSEIAHGFPGSPLVFLMRDPRDTIVSMRKAFGGTIEEAAHVWNEAFERYAEASDRVHLVRYEELAREPVRVVEELCGFVGESYEPGMMRFFENVPEQLRALTHLDLGPLSSPVMATSIGNYREHPLDDIRRIETACAAGMEAMGYPFTLGPAREGVQRRTRPGRLHAVIARLRYYGLNRERWRRGWFRWSLLARLYARHLLRIGPLRARSAPRSR